MFRTGHSGPPEVPASIGGQRACGGELSALQQRRPRAGGRFGSGLVAAIVPFGVGCALAAAVVVAHAQLPTAAVVVGAAASVVLFELGGAHFDGWHR